MNITDNKVTNFEMTEPVTPTYYMTAIKRYQTPPNLYVDSMYVTSHILCNNIKLPEVFKGKLRKIRNWKCN